MYSYEDYCEYFEMTEADAVVHEYQEKMKELLVKPILDNINILQEENERLKKENATVAEKTRELAQLKREFEREKTKLIECEAEKYRRSLFAVQGGDIVYIVGSDETKEKCKHCNGTHKITVMVLDKEQKLDCPKCSYGGTFISDKTFHPLKMVVRTAALHIYDENKKSETHVYVYPYGGSRNEDAMECVPHTSNDYRTKFYMTLEECEQECKSKREAWLKSNK